MIQGSSNWVTWYMYVSPRVRPPFSGSPALHGTRVLRRQRRIQDHGQGRRRFRSGNVSPGKMMSGLLGAPFPF